MSKMATDRVTINVGGTKYELYRSTFAVYPQTFLAALVSNGYAESNQAEIFINWSPKYFDLIVRFYLTGQLEQPSDISAAAWHKELDFWQLATPKLESPLHTLIDTERKFFRDILTNWLDYEYDFIMTCLRGSYSRREMSHCQLDQRFCFSLIFSGFFFRADLAREHAARTIGKSIQTIYTENQIRALAIVGTHFINQRASGNQTVTYASIFESNQIVDQALWEEVQTKINLSNNIPLYLEKSALCREELVNLMHQRGFSCKWQEINIFDCPENNTDRCNSRVLKVPSDKKAIEFKDQVDKLEPESLGIPLVVNPYFNTNLGVTQLQHVICRYCRLAYMEVNSIPCPNRRWKRDPLKLLCLKLYVNE